MKEPQIPRKDCIAIYSGEECRKVFNFYFNNSWWCLHLRRNIYSL